MARVAYLSHEFYEPSLGATGELLWNPDVAKKPIERLPQIYWNDGRAWDEANVWALDRAASGDVVEETIARAMKYLCAFANYLERRGMDWRHFPLRRQDQVLRKFRKHLMDERDDAMLASSTATSCMNVVIQFYRFANMHGLVGARVPMWADRTVVIPFHDATGFKRAIVQKSTDLSIPNRKPVGSTLEDGLWPLCAEHMDNLLAYTARHETPELHLMLSTGFFSGARIGTITTLTVTSLLTAREDPLVPGVFRLPVGPGTGIATKFSVPGDLMVPKAVLADLIAYASATMRLLREAKTPRVHKNRLFLTRRGQPYTVGTVDRLVNDMRRRAVSAGMQFMEQFTFHQSRATFGTWLVELLLNAGASVTDALGIVRDAMLHKDESTTLRYIKFPQNTEARQRAAAAFNQAFTGLANRNWNQFKS